MSCVTTSPESRSRRRTPRTPASSRFENSGNTSWLPPPSKLSGRPRRNAGARRRRARAERRNLLWDCLHSRLVAAPRGIARKIRTILDVQDVPMTPPARRGGRSWLLHPRRLEVLLAAAAYPGLHLRSASRLLLQPLPSLRYHVEQLVEQGFLERRRYGGRTALFASGVYPRTSERFLVAWEDPIERAILVALAGRQRTHVDVIAEAARLPVPSLLG